MDESMLDVVISKVLASEKPIKLLIVNQCEEIICYHPLQETDDDQILRSEKEDNFVNFIRNESGFDDYSYGSFAMDSHQTLKEKLLDINRACIEIGCFWIEGSYDCEPFTNGLTWRDIRENAPMGDYELVYHFKVENGSLQQLVRT